MPECDGRCLYPSDLGFPEWDRGEPAYPDPMCSLHGATEDDYPPLTPEEEETVLPDTGR
jgi:hypothetical protein